MKLNELVNFTDFIWVLTHEEKALVLLLAFGFTESELSGRFDFEKLSARIENKFAHFQKEVKGPTNVVKNIH